MAYLLEPELFVGLIGNGKTKMEATEDVERLQKLKTGLQRVLDLQHMSFGIMVPKTFIELDLKEWY